MDALDRAECEGVVSRYLSRLLGTAVGADHAHYAAALERLDALLIYHAARFAEAGKPTDKPWLLQQLRAGRLAFRDCSDCDLLEDVFLALLMERRVKEALCEFQRRFAMRIEQWARRYHPSEPDWADALAGDLIVPRARSGPRIATYAGHGPLRSWLRVVVRKLAPRPPRRSRAPLIQPDDEAGGLDGLGGRVLAHASFCPVDVEFERQNCRELLAPAFLGCFDALDATERLVLLQSIVDGVPQKHIARELGVQEYDVTRIKQRAIALVRQRFHELAAGLMRGGREAVLTCLELLRERFSDVPLDLTRIAVSKKARNSPGDGGP